MLSIAAGIRAAPRSISIVILALSPAFAASPDDPDLRDQQIRAAMDANDWAQADSLLVEAISSVEARAPVDSLELADHLNRLADTRARRGRVRDDETIELAQRSLTVREKKLGPDALEVAVSLSTLAMIHAQRRDMAPSKSCAERALRIRESQLEPDDPLVGRSLNNLGNVAWASRELATAREYYERALEVYEAAYGPEHRLVGDMYHNLGMLAGALGEYDESRKSLERSVAVIEKASGSDHPAVANALRNLATTYKNLNEYPRAQEALERALAIQESRLEPDNPSLGLTLSNLAEVQWNRGDPDAAIASWDRTLSIYREAYGPQHPRVASALYTVARARYSVGDYSSAMDYVERSISIREARGGPDDRDVAGGLELESRILRAQGRDEQAWPLLQRVLMIRESALGAEHPSVASTYTSMAYFHLSDGEAEQALMAAEKSLAIRTRRRGADHPSLASTLDAMGRAQARLGRLEEARSTLERSVGIIEAGLGIETPSFATASFELGEILLAMEDYDAARHRFALGIDCLRQLFEDEHPAITQGLTGHAYASYALGDRATAFEMALESERISRGQARLSIRTLPERPALRVAARREQALDLIVSLAVEGLSPQDTERAWNAVIGARALVLDELARRVATRPAKAPRIETLLRELTRARRALAHRQSLAAASEESEGDEALALAQTRIADLEAQLAQLDAATTPDGSAEVSLREVVESLPPRGALVAYVVYRPVAPVGVSLRDAPGYSERPTAYAALVAAPDLEPKVLSIGSGAAVSTIAYEWCQEISRGALVESRSDRGSEVVCRDVGARLRQLIWDPVGGELSGFERVVIVPAEILHVVPFAALPTADGYLVDESLLLHMVSAERDIARFSRVRAQARGLLAVGGVDFDAESEPELSADIRTASESAGAVVEASALRGPDALCPEFQEVRFSPLRLSGDEVEGIAGLWREAATNLGEAVTLTGGAANEAAVKRLAPGRRILHLATHGFFLESSCVAHGAGLRGVGRLSSTRTQPPQPARPGTDVARAVGALARSGLALAGSNRRAEAGPDEEDGILTAEEIATLDLGSVEWAVLSACETGLGEVFEAEGIFGLRRALRVAGARTSIVSLWSIQDQEALRWMEALYRNRLVDGLDTAQSVRAATRQSLQERRRDGKSTHPFHWAGFVSTGDWR